MKRILAMLLALLCLASCGGPTDTTDTTGNTDNTSTPIESDSIPATDETEPPVEIDEHSNLAAISPSANGKHKIVFENGHFHEFDAANATVLFDEAKALGYNGSLLGWLGNSAFEIEKKFYRGTEIGAKAFGTALAAIFENYGEHFTIGGKSGDGEIVVNENVGYLGVDGVSHPNSETQTYRFTQKIPVSEGQTFTVVSDGKALGMRFVTAYSGAAANQSLSLIDASCTTTKFEVPAGVTHIAATFRHTGKEVVVRLTGGLSNPKPLLKSKFDSEEFMELITGAPVAFNPDLSKSADTLKDGYLLLENNDVMHNKTLRLVCNLNELKDGEMIVIGHGETSYGGSALEVTRDRVCVYNYTTARADAFTDSHGIALSGLVEIEVRVGMGIATLSIENETDKYVSTTFSWSGRQGEIFAKSVGVELKNVQLLWKCSDYDKDIWLMGDSYFNTTTSTRWPYYMSQAGYTDYFMSGFPGRNSQRAIIDFKLALEHGTPKYAVWCLGMNNKDSESAISTTYKEATDEFLALCKEYGIIPILSTIPNTPTVINTHKNAWVRASGYRYIDFAAAVGGEETGSSWLPKMLSGDNVHPNPEGAVELYNQFIKDFPEIKG